AGHEAGEVQHPDRRAPGAQVRRAEDQPARVGQGIHATRARGGAGVARPVLHRLDFARRGDPEAEEKQYSDSGRPGSQDWRERADPLGLRARSGPQSGRNLRLQSPTMKKILLFVIAAMLPLGAHAQSWPSRPVKFILSLGPGSGADLTGRMLADRLSKVWGQPVVVENRPGADAVLAINAVI